MQGGSAGEPPQRRVRPRFAAGLAALVIAAHFAAMYDPDQALATDSRYYTHFGIAIARGAVPHRDFFGNKTQLAAMLAAVQVHLGSGLGLDAVESIRLGSLFFAFLGGLLLYALHRTWSRGDEVAAWLGLLPILGFAYLGTLPATGSVPKLLMAVAATGAALLVSRGSWMAAGFVAAIAPLDWQIGVVTCFGVFAAAAADERPRRALARSGAAVGLVALVFVGYFTLEGALGPMLLQTVAASFARGTEAGGPLLKFAGIATRLGMNAAGEGGLVAAGCVGAIVFPFWLRMERFAAMRKSMIVMAVHHYGVVGFSLIDFQGSGDTMLLLHSLAFFAGVTFVSVWILSSRVAALAPLRPWPAVVVLALALVLTHPVFSDPPKIETPDSPQGVTLSDQRAFAARLAPLVEGRSLLVLGPTELLVLGDFQHATRYHYWNDATRYDYARNHPGTTGDLLGALVEETKPQVIVASRYLSFPPGLPYRGVDLGRPGGYAVRVFVRVDEGSD